MRSPLKGYGRVYALLSSKELTITLFALLCPALIITTFTDKAPSLIWYFIITLFALIAVNLVLCTLKRINTVSDPVLLMHIGVLVSFAGGGISAFGFVATVNIYEGETAETVYRWDMEKDVSLGIKITAQKLHEEYYPIPLKVGVLRGEEKAGLFTLKTGESFYLEKYRIQADALDIGLKSLKLSIYDGNRFIGYADTSGEMEVLQDFPFVFKLVAYMDPVIKSAGVDLLLSKDGEVVAEGRTEVNDPLKWQGLNFFHTATNRDSYGNPFVGIQVTRDPGTPMVFTGFCIFAAGGMLYFLRRMRA